MAGLPETLPVAGRRQGGACASTGLERKIPTFDSHAELRDTFRELRYAGTMSTPWCPPNGGNFARAAMSMTSSGRGGAYDMKGLLAFTRMTGDPGQGDAGLRANGHRPTAWRRRRR